MFGLAMVLGAVGLVVVVVVLRAGRGGPGDSRRDTASGSYVYGDSGGSADATDCAADCADGGSGSDGGCDAGGGSD